MEGEGSMEEKQGNITRKDLARAIHEQMGLPLRGAGRIVDEVFACMRETLLAEEPIKLVQFGSFHVIKKRERVGRNPRTGETMAIAPRSMISFKPSKILRARINE